MLIEEADHFLKLNKEVCGFAYPVSASFFKITSPLSTGFKLFFAAHIFYVPLSFSAISIFMATVLLLSFTSRGIPSEGTGFSNVPLYVASGVPAEGYFLIKSLYTIPDIFETISNLTGYLLIATLLHRFIGNRILKESNAI